MVASVLHDKYKSAGGDALSECAGSGRAIHGKRDGSDTDDCGERADHERYGFRWGQFKCEPRRGTVQHHIGIAKLPGGIAKLFGFV